MKTAAAALAGAAVLVSAAACGGTLDGGRRVECHGRTAEVPGSGPYDQLSFTSVSCTSAGSCTAGGFYRAGSAVVQGFVVSRVHGVWGKPENLPGLAALNTHRDAVVGLVSCASAGNCTAGGYYTNGRTNPGTHYQRNASQVFVASEVNGVWCNAEEIPGTAALNKGKDAGLSSMSCPSAGNCSAAGSYSSLAPSPSLTESNRGFVASEVNGVWGNAQPIPGSYQLTAVSCASAGNCSATGYYDTARPASAFVLSQTHGVWGKLVAVPGFAALNQGGNGYIESLSCASAGNCSGTGSYTDSTGDQQAFAVSEVHGIWQNAQRIPGTGAPAYTQSGAGSVSCGSPGNCSAGGGIGDSRSKQAFVASQVNGVWKKAEEVPGSVALNTGNVAEVTSVSCASAGNCSAAGHYAGRGQTFVVSEVDGVWGKAEKLPRLGGAQTPVSCASPGNCTVTGSYGYLASQVNGVWGRPERIGPPARS